MLSSSADIISMFSLFISKQLVTGKSLILCPSIGNLVCVTETSIIMVMSYLDISKVIRCIYLCVTKSSVIIGTTRCMGLAMLPRHQCVWGRLDVWGLLCYQDISVYGDDWMYGACYVTKTSVCMGTTGCMGLAMLPRHQCVWGRLDVWGLLCYQDISDYGDDWMYGACYVTKTSVIMGTTGCMGLAMLPRHQW